MAESPDTNNSVGDATSKEPVNLQKAASGLVDPRNTIKSLVFNFHTLMLIFVIFGAVHVFNMIFPKKATNSQSQNSSLTIEKGAHVDKLVFANKQEQEVKKKTVGLEVGISSVDAEVGFVKYINDNNYVTLGPRFRFEKDSDGKQEVMPFVRYHHDF